MPTDIFRNKYTVKSILVDFETQYSSILFIRLCPQNFNEKIGKFLLGMS